ncbi:hypothetical protein ACIQKB_38610 [Streptomyces sp. NPDC092046]|uniref:hypothetical protein n=1 Tax=Streptomyces sp. NPDC092046 TaxID=3366009 RepID=UPI00381EA64E
MVASCSPVRGAVGRDIDSNSCITIRRLWPSGGMVGGKSFFHPADVVGASYPGAIMRLPVLSAAALVVALGALTGCGSGSDEKNAGPESSGPKSTASVSAAADGGTKPAGKPLAAGDVFTQLSAKVSTAKLSGVVTEDNDPNHLLGRPNQYTSKITFTDSRIKADDVTGSGPGSVERGGAIEVFATAADAQARADYIGKVTKGMPVLVEYDYVSGPVLVRVSRYLTPSQAADYKAGAVSLG